MKSLLAQPLTHFLIAGACLFWLFDVVSEGPEADDVSSSDIVVTRDALVDFLHLRARTFDRSRFEEMLDAMPDVDLSALIEDFVRDEALFREALRLGLHLEDSVIRERLVQKVEFVTSGFTRATTKIDDRSVREYWETRKDDYLVKAVVSFTHIFFDSGERGADEALRLAEEKLAATRLDPPTAEESAGQGDPFPFRRTYDRRTREVVEAHFGPAMTDRVFALEPDAESWRGPFRSPHGFHLVLVTERLPERYPELGRIMDRVREDALAAIERERTAAALERVVSRYDVRVEYRPETRRSESESP